MRSMYGPDQLLLASKKPRIMELVSRAKNMSEDEIRALPERPDVIRGLLLIRLFGEDQSKATVAEKVASLMQKNHVDQPSKEDAPCRVFRISLVVDGWLKTGSTMMEIQEGWNWAQLSDGMIYLTNLPVRLDPDALEKLKESSQHVGDMSLAEFKELERQRRNSLQPHFIFPIA